MLARLFKLVTGPEAPNPKRAMAAAYDHPEIVIAVAEMRQVGGHLGCAALGELGTGLADRMADICEDLELAPEHITNVLFRLDPTIAWHDGEIEVYGR